jgi:hypothetical protein
MLVGLPERHSADVVSAALAAKMTEFPPSSDAGGRSSPCPLTVRCCTLLRRVASAGVGQIETSVRSRATVERRGQDASATWRPRLSRARNPSPSRRCSRRSCVLASKNGLCCQQQTSVGGGCHGNMRRLQHDLGRE